MACRTLQSSFLLAVFFGLWISCEVAFGQAAKSGQLTLHELSMEVAALQALRQFDFTSKQLETLQKLAKESAAEVGIRQAAKASDDFRKALTNLRDALIEGTDERIDELQERIEDLRNTESPEVDDGLEVTDDARRHAPQVLALLSARQVATYIASEAEEFPDPGQRLLDALAKVRRLDAKEWKKLRDEVSEEVGRLVAGLDDEKAGETADKVIQLLIHARALKEAEFKSQCPELEKSARQIVGKLGPFDVLRHVTEQALAELLSNPRLPAAIEVRLKK